jgi:FAD/FMN-containing dehydrogenase
MRTTAIPTTVLVWCISCALVTASFTLHPRAVPDYDDIRHTLGPLLSQGADIYDPSAPEWGNLTTRWTPFGAPTPSVTVEVATQADVQHTVKYAVSRGLKIIVRTTGHGNTLSLLELDGGLQISLARMNKISADADANTMTIEGGVRTVQVIETLQAKNQVTPVVLGDCVGVLGAGLGGGAGPLQGKYGLISDVLKEAEVVLADGSVVTASKHKNSDLFWALRGAGTDSNYSSL